MNRRLQAAFNDIDGLRNCLLTGPAAGDRVMVDIATGLLPMSEALAQEAVRRGKELVLSIDGQGSIVFADESHERRFREATAEVSRDPNAGGGPRRPLQTADRERPAGGNPQSAQVGEAADALLATIGRIERAQSRLTSLPMFIHFTELSTLLAANTIPSARARSVLNAVGKLLATGRGSTESRIVVTMREDVLHDAEALLNQHDLGATPWHHARVPLPDVEEIEQFLDRAKDRHELTGNVKATAMTLGQRGYPMARIAEALRRLVDRNERDLTTIIGGEAKPELLAEAQRELDAMVGLTELKSELGKLAAQFPAIQASLQRGETNDPPATHMALLGRPGTGKSEVVKIIAKMLHAAGLRRQPEPVTATSADIIGQYNSGEAIQNIRRLVQRAADGVLFIDEAYTLADNEWGRQAFDSLIAVMEERRGSLTVILAGYPDRMQRLFEANEGLRSRIAYTFRLPDYSADELCEIFDRRVERQSIRTTPTAREAAHRIIRREATRRHGNGRDVRNLLEAWNRERLAQRATELALSHVRDPRESSRVAAEREIARFGEDFRNLPEVEGWMKDTLRSSIDALGAGRLPRAPRLVFAGPPGTGKTESARRIGAFLKACGVLRDGRVIETAAKDFTSSLVGGAAERTERLFRDAAECVLFIDEFYMFARDSQLQGVLDQIVAALTHPDYGNVAVIVAGYEESLQEVYRANPGLKDRFHRTIRFNWPDSTTLARISLDRLARVYGRTWEPEAEGHLLNAVSGVLTQQRSLPDFAGARTAINIAEAINDRFLRREGAMLTADDVPKPTAPPRFSEITTEFLREFPFSKAASELLPQILAASMDHRDSTQARTASLGIVLVGGPGGGKSTFARWFMNRLARREDAAPAPIEERSCQSLQGTHLGEAQANVRQAFERARGGFLFIDEFHQLAGERGASRNLYSVEIAREIVAQMTAAANASTTVILAGYPTEMQSALETDAGLASRIALAIELPMPTDEDLARTTHRLLETRSGGSFRTPYEMLASLLTGHFARLRADDVARFGGYRAADRLAERVRMNARIRHDGASGYRIEVEDVLKALQA